MASKSPHHRPERRRRPQKVRDVAADTTSTEPPSATSPDDLAANEGSQPRIKESDITGLKYFDKLSPLLEHLHDDGCERDKAGNRELHYDQYCLLILLFLFNPIVTSLRGIQQASELKKVQKKLGCSRASLGSLSEAVTVFDPERLKRIIAELGQELQPLGRHERPTGIQQTLTIVDGTLLNALPRIVDASFRKHNDGSVKWRLHTHFEVDRYVPTRIDVTPDGKGENQERAVLQRTIEPDRLYLLDRGYVKYSLYNNIVSAGSSYVCRLRDNSSAEIVEHRELTEQDRAAGVLSDQIVTFGKGRTPAECPQHTMRMVCVQCTPHTRRGKRCGKDTSASTGPPSDGTLRIVTNLLDVPAEIIALLYSQRWIIEIFFRFFKHLLGCRHLLSHKKNGVEIQAYCAIIACMLISLWTGRKPTKRTYEMVCYYFCGLASQEELLAHLTKLQRQDEEAQRNTTSKNK